ncbi:hypothetical protein ACFWZH_37255, partial [Streptomyces sp. NPDC059008]
ETAPAGLAAAGIEPQVLPAPEQSAAPALEPRAQEPAEALPSQWFAAPQQVTYQGDYDPDYVPEPEHQPSPDAHRQVPPREQVPVPAPRAPEPEPQVPVPTGAGGTRPLGKGIPEADPQPAPAPAAAPTDEDLYQVFRRSIEGEGMPTAGAFAANLEAQYGTRMRARELNRYMDRFSDRLNAELMDEHIA